MKKQILLILLMFLCACSSLNPTPVPTADQQSVVAAVVETINAQSTSEAIMHPSVTPFPTATPLPPTATTLPATEIPTATVPLDTPTPEFTLSAQLAYVTAYPEDKRIYIPNERYSIAIGFKNTGTLTWEAGSTIKLISFKGEVTVATTLTVDKAVRPGEKMEYDLWAFGSETLGDHTFNFQLYTSDGLAIPGGFASFSYTSV